MKAVALFALVALAAYAGADVSDPDVAERYVQCYGGEIQLLPALARDEMCKGRVKGVKAVGGFVFDIEWVENKATWMRVRSEKGGVCRIRSYGGIGSPLMRKARGECPNPAIAATRDARRRLTTPESCFDRKDRPLQSVCLDFDTEPGEVLEFRGVAGNQDWTDYAGSRDDAFFGTDEARRIAGNVLAYQLETGGWPKNVPMQDVLSAKERRMVESFKGDRRRGTIDNGATFTEIRYLARMYKATGGREYLDGALRGIGFLLALQYPNGGWPQCDPAKVGYWHQITYNDGAMLNAMKAMRDVYESNSPFDVPIPQATRDACRKAFRKGLVCILKTQIVQNGKPTLWCQQHDRDTLEPCVGRSFELPSICTLESGDIALFLMGLDLDEYSAGAAGKIRESIEGAVEWYRANGMRGYKIEKGWRRDDGIKTDRLVRTDDESAPTLWCRYYTLEDNRPFTGRRDGTKNFDFSEMERGENMSYMWFNARGAQVERAYAKWQKRIEKPMASAEARRSENPTTLGIGRGSGDGAVRHPPRYEPTTLRVSAGESLQAVIDSIPEGSLRPFVVRVAPGRYREKVRFAGRRARVSLVADDPAPGRTVISWNDTPSTPGPDGRGLGTSGSATLTVDIADFTMDGFTVENTGTPERLAATDGKEQAGQCVALLARGDRSTFRNCRFLGWQDTVFAGGSVGNAPARQYFEKCRIEGSVDFIFGGSVALFKDCEIHSVNGGYVTAGSHAPDLPFGYVFMNCRVTCVEGKRTSLGRPWRPYANVTWIGCDFGDAVTPEGWSDWTTDNERRVYRSAEYCCTSKGEAKRPGHIVVGGKEELQDRLRAAGFRKVSDIVAGADEWRPMRAAELAACEGESRAVKMLESEMARMPVPAGIDARKKPKWEYTDGLLLQGALAVGERHPEIKARVRAWAQDYIDRMVTKDGEIRGYRKADCKLDCINPGKFAFDMYELAVGRGDETEAARLKKVLDEQFSQFAIQPRVSEGGFWHKKVYPHQMWLDGLYMGCPYYARYAAKFLDGEARRKAFDDIANQFAVVTRHTYDAKTGLYRHGWDEAKAQVWADRETGQSRHAWGRALGWFAAAIVDTLDYLPKDHPGHAQLAKLADGYFKSLARWQDESGAWWQVADQPGREGNYLEATATALIGYAMVKAWNRGYVGEEARDAGLKAFDALNRDFIRENGDGTISLTRCCAVAGLSADRDGSFEYYLREPIRDNDHKGTGPYMLLALEMAALRDA